MVDKGEKSCPICTEEMDLTDQQLKPCKCGYEVWTCFFTYTYATNICVFISIKVFLSSCACVCVP